MGLLSDEPWVSLLCSGFVKVVQDCEYKLQVRKSSVVAGIQGNIDRRFCFGIEHDFPFLGSWGKDASVKKAR